MKYDKENNLYTMSRSEVQITVSQLQHFYFLFQLQQDTLLK